MVRRSMKTSTPSGVSRSNITVAAGLTGIDSRVIAGDGNAFRSLRLVLVWMDLEMTGLEPSRHVIVEIATLITDDDLKVVAEGPDLVIHQDEDALAQMDPVVVEMHAAGCWMPSVPRRSHSTTPGRRPWSSSRPT